MFFAPLLTLSTAILAVSAASVPKRRGQTTAYTSCTKPNMVALTFDDGPYEWHKNVSDQLTAAGAKGTFFMNGNNWDCIYGGDLPERVQYAYNAGHQVGDHTWAHANLTTLTKEQIVDSFYRTEEAFSRILGVIPAFMRPPYGSYNDDVLEVASDRGQTVVTWDNDSGDSDGATVAQQKATYAAAVKAKPSNMIFLNHETYNTTVFEILPYALELLQGAGYELVTVAECFGMEPYQAIGIPQTTGPWTCDGSPAPGQGCASGACESGSVYLATATGSSSTKTTTTTSTSTSTSSSKTTTTTSTPTVTGKSIRPSANSAKCLTAASNTDGAKVELETCAGTTKQAWTVTGGTLQIYGNKCLDVTNGSTANGNKMQIYTCSSGNKNQQFTVTSSKTIQWTGTSECLDLTGGSTASNTVMQMWTCSAGDNNQVWNFS